MCAYVFFNKNQSSLIGWIEEMFSDQICTRVFLWLHSFRKIGKGFFLFPKIYWNFLCSIENDWNIKYVINLLYIF